MATMSLISGHHLKERDWRLPIILFLVVHFAFTTVNGQADSEPNEADYYRLVPVYSDGASSGLKIQRRNSPLPYGARQGSATNTNTCQQVRAVPSNLRLASAMKPNGIDYFYQKYTEVYGIPVLSSRSVPDGALKRACYTLRFLLAGNKAVRHSFYRLFGRVAVIGAHENTTSTPEHSHLDDWWNQRARGLGATPHSPVSTGGEENLMCYQHDRYRNQDIFLHELVHGVHLLGAAYAIPGWDRRLRSLYQKSKANGLWANTYSMSTAEEYFAEGTQSYFNVNSHSPTADGVRGPISTRTKLRAYDIDLYNLIQEVFPCDNPYLKRCQSNRVRENAQHLKMDCDSNTGSDTGSGGDCIDKNENCVYWSNTNQCNINPAFMEKSCRKSCGLCPESCKDKNQSCAAWADLGECSKNSAYMNPNCPVSCDLC